MQFVFTEEQLLIQETARGFFAEHGEKLRAVLESDEAYDRALWSEVMREMGFGGIAFPEAYGGSALGHVELAIVLTEMGRVLYPSPYLPSVCMAAPAILHGGNDAQRERLLPGLISGETIATLACAGTGWRQHDVSDTLLAGAGDAFVLSGSASFVPFAHLADHIVVVARTATGGLSLVVLPTDRAGIEVVLHGTMDPTRPLSTVHFSEVSVTRDDILGEPGGADAVVAHVYDLARIAIAAEQAGTAETVLDRTVEYVGQRFQFGRAIGSFQAIKHRLADMMVRVETAKTAALYADCVVDEAPAELSEAAAIAKSYCSDALFEIAGHAIQLHGGIGFTWEHDAHLWFKRAKASANLLGDADWQRERLATIIGLDDGAQSSALAAAS